jgi:hypothetical protein
VAVDLRYLVAFQRYEITKEIRSVLIGHFEDHFQSLEHVNDMARRLKSLAEKTGTTTETLLRSRGSSVSGHSQADPGGVSDAFDRVWRVRPDAGDLEVANFAAWAAPLLHLMVHKAYCVLYHPLFRDPNMGAYESIRSK